MAFKPPSPGTKPKMTAAPAKTPGRTPFVLGSRPDALRAAAPAPVNRIKPAPASTRDYAKNGPQPSVAGAGFNQGGGI